MHREATQRQQVVVQLALCSSGGPSGYGHVAGARARVKQWSGASQPSTTHIIQKWDVLDSCLLKFKVFEASSGASLVAYCFSLLLIAYRLALTYPFDSKQTTCIMAAALSHSSGRAG